MHSERQQYHNRVPMKPSDVAARISEYARAQSHRSRSHSHSPDPNPRLHAPLNRETGKPHAHTHESSHDPYPRVGQPGGDVSDRKNVNPADAALQNLQLSSEVDDALDTALKAGALRRAETMVASAMHLSVNHRSLQLDCCRPNHLH